jgi:hypothetical protein
MTLLCLSSLAEGAVEVAGEVALDAAADFPVGLAFGTAVLDVGDGRWVAAHAGDGDGVDGAVELAVAEAVEPVAVGAAGGDRDGRGAGEHAEGGFAVNASGVGPGQQDLGGGQGAEAGFGGDQAGGHVFDDPGDLCPGPGSLFREGGDALAEADQGLVQDPVRLEYTIAA